MVNYEYERARDAEWRVAISRSEGKVGVTGAWEAAATAWEQHKAALAEDLEREAYRMEFAIEVHRYLAKIKDEYRKRMREEETPILLAGELISIESAWLNVLEWVESDAGAATAWIRPHELSYAYTFDGDVAKQWAIHFGEVNFTENLLAWIVAAKSRLDCQIELLKEQRNLLQLGDSDGIERMYTCFAWEEAIALWTRVVEIRTAGDTNGASELETKAETWMKVAGSSVAKRIWFPLNQATEERDKGRADIALAWEHAAKAYLEGRLRIAKAWESAAFDLEEAWAEESAAERSEPS